MDATTDTADVVKSLPRTINLAKEVFGHTTMATVRAFSQFKHNSHLARLIDAKREGKFDFGVTIKDTASGAEWPEAADVIKALDEVEAEGDISQTSVDALGLESQEELDALLMKEGEKATKKKAPAKKKKAPAKKKEPAAKKAAPKRVAAKKKTEPEETSGDDSDPLAVLLEKFENLGKGLEEAFTELHDRRTEENEILAGDIQALGGKLDSVLDTMSTVGRMVIGLNINLMTVGEYIDEHMGLIDIAGLELPDDGEGDEGESEAGSTASDRRSGSESSSDAGDDQEEGAPESEEEEEVEEVDPGELYSVEALQAKEVKELVEIAEGLGIANAHKISIRGVLIRKIRKAQAPTQA